MAGVKFYSSADAGAPVLSGQAGALIALLDAVLINGYGSQAALGWTKPYSGTNKAVYRLDHSLNSGRYLRVDDSNAQYAIVNAFHAMTDVDTGTGGFPAIATPRYWKKSHASDATARVWYLYGDEAFFYFLPRWSNTAGWEEALYPFGDLVGSHDMPGAVTVLSGHNNSTPSFPMTSMSFININGATNGTENHSMPAANGSLVDDPFRCVSHYLAGALIGGSGWLPPNAAEPNGVTMRASPVDVVRYDNSNDVDNWYKGRLPGLMAPWSINTEASGLHGTEYDDLIDGGGRTYRAQQYDYSTTNATIFLIDITGPWR